MTVDDLIDALIRQIGTTQNNLVSVNILLPAAEALMAELIEMRRAAQPERVKEVR